jgi:hypothetical protein
MNTENIHAKSVETNTLVNDEVQIS